MNSFQEKKMIWIGDLSELKKNQIPLDIFRIYSSISDFQKDLLSYRDINYILLFYDSSFSLISFSELVRPLNISHSRFELILIMDQKCLHNSSDLVRNAINRGQVDLVFTLNQEDHSLFDFIHKVKEKFEDELLHQDFLKKSNTVLKELDALNFSLEKIVNERTYGIAESKKEEEKKLKREQDIIKFIKELSLCQSLEEVFFSFREELKKNHGVNEVILLHKRSDERIDLFYFLNRQINKKSVDEKKLFGHSFDETNYLSFLANLFGRPFVKSDRVDIHSQYGEIQFLIENSIGLEFKDLFSEFLSDRILLVNLALDRIFLEDQVHIYSTRWEKTFDNISGAMAIIDKNFKVTRSNKQFRQGRHQSMIQPEFHCYEIFAHRNSPCENCCLLNSLDKKLNQSVQIISDKRIYQMSCHPIYDESDLNLSYSINQYIDITSSRELYLKLLQSEKISSIGLLAGNIAHELNNPLTGIRSMVQVLKSEPNLNLRQINDLDEIEKGAARCHLIIKNLLDFSAGKREVQQKVSFDDLVEKTLPMLKSVLRFFQCTLNLQAQGVEVLVEPSLIQQVIFNVVNNACQAMVNRGQIQISSQKIDEDWVELVISDTGQGIPVEIQSRIFEPFFSSKKDSFGTGLGLSFAKDVVTKHGGTISFQSEMGIGTQFYIRLPIVRGES